LLRTVFAVLLCVASAVHAEIADSTPSGFTLKFSATVRAQPAEAYRRIVRIGEWWASDHTYSGDARNMAIDARAGGCFCEKLPGGGAVEHARVILASPGKTLRMYGGLGPLQGIAAAGPMTFQLKPEQGGTKLELTYAVTGYLPQGLGPTWAGPVNDVLGSQFERLKTYLETGSATSKAAEQPKAQKPPAH
jgi:hypothetical protein